MAFMSYKSWVWKQSTSFMPHWRHVLRNTSIFSICEGKSIQVKQQVPMAISRFQILITPKTWRHEKRTAPDTLWTPSFHTVCKFLVLLTLRCKPLKSISAQNFKSTAIYFVMTDRQTDKFKIIPIVLFTRINISYLFKSYGAAVYFLDWIRVDGIHQSVKQKKQTHQWRLVWSSFKSTLKHATYTKQAIINLSKPLSTLYNSFELNFETSVTRCQQRHWKTHTTSFTVTWSQPNVWMVIWTPTLRLARLHLCVYMCVTFE